MTIIRRAIITIIGGVIWLKMMELEKNNSLLETNQKIVYAKLSYSLEHLVKIMKKIVENKHKYY